MKIAMLGSFDPTYPRNRIIIRGLRLAGAKVFPYTTEKGYLSRIIDVLRAVCRMDYDIVLLGHIGQYYVPPLKITLQSPIILDLFAPLYESLVDDRKIFNRFGFSSFSCFLMDWLGLTLSDLSLIDTYTHRDYVAKQYNLSLKKLAVIYPGSDDSAIYPVFNHIQPQKTFIVSYHGSFIPFHGVEHILYAAYSLKQYKSQISFQIIGEGQNFQKIKALKQHLGLTNVELLPPVPYDNLRFFLSKADVCLGVFGNSQKLDRVIPYKIFDALAMGKPIITASSNACSEILTDKNTLFCEKGNPRDLADKIMILFKNREIAYEMGKNGYALFKERFTPIHIGKELIHHFKRLL